MKKASLTYLGFAFAALILSESAHAYKYVIYTDQGSTQKAKEVAAVMGKTYPFNKFDIQFEIVLLPEKELKCKPVYGIERALSCEDSFDGLKAMTYRRRGDQAMVIKDVEKEGGASHVGGGVPVISSKSSARVMMHEYLHTLGLCDEYKYPAEETKIYCDDKAPKGGNIAYIEPLGSYGSDAEARGLHSGAIPWYKDIKPKTLITSGSALGTGAVDNKRKAVVNENSIPTALDETTGLYRGKVCDEATPPKTTWHPGGQVTIMDDADAGLGASLEVMVEEKLVGLGIRKKLEFQNDQPEILPPAERSPSSVVVSAEPDAAIDNSSRGFFKSFFTWLSDLFQSFGRAISR